ncbi:LytR/AlgR family response regulator transcription factor [Alteromonas sp. 009811495]|uniref:LytR/AlgR family response regulator transcription factor n=1 Tax=Alteromonas sp. 009811495 TaxID=3002962 RepID=UPI00237DF865|nr:LytTR family DNA-binding domain-containing protein [Alteromonas sp. 009811495]WDT84975.1 LytTR family DNA-binding domain-containing protein [Alteromonas sp. 009811495]
MNSWDEKWSQYLRDTEPKHKYAAFLLLVVYLFINNSINAASSWTEFSRSESNSVALWEPYVWEYSSALSTAILVIPLILAIRVLDKSKKSSAVWLGWHFVFASVFSVSHVVFMVALRKLAYLMSERSYDFGVWISEFVYEYRKDVWGYITLVTFYYIARFGYQRLIGEASLIKRDTSLPEVESEALALPDYLLVKKLNKEFLVKVSDVQRVEASGNYINLHTHVGVYPLRYTLSRFCEEGAMHGFVRVHRSHAVRIPSIQSITYDDTGDGLITLNNGQTVLLSRRYKDNLKQVLAP